jgi:hypothetical protein
LSDDSKSPEASKKGWEGEPTRRNVLTTIASAGVVGLCADSGNAADLQGLAPQPGAFNLLDLFHQAVDAFNHMSSTPQNQSPLLNLLDPNKVMILDVNDDSGWFTGTGPAAVAKLYTLAGANFDPFHDINGNSVTPTLVGNKVKGTFSNGNPAIWVDFNNSQVDLIPYTFTYKNGRIVRMRARSE